MCTSTGVAGLAKAISVVDRGGEVFVASSGVDAATVDGQARVAWEAVRVHPRLGEIVSDLETIEYFAALSCDLDDRCRPDGEVVLPIRVAHERASVGHGGAVLPFVGSQLRDWAADCLASPSGYLYTRVSGWESATLQTRDGDSIEVAEIGSMTPHRNDVGGSVYEWLTCGDPATADRAASELLTTAARFRRRRCCGGGLYDFLWAAGRLGPDTVS